MIKLKVGDNVQFVNKGKLIEGEVLKMRDLTVEPLKMESVIVLFPMIKRSRILYTIQMFDGSIRSYYGRSMLRVRKSVDIKIPKNSPKMYFGFKV